MSVLLLGLLVVNPICAGEPRGKIIEDLWDAAYLQGTRSGFVHTTVTEFEVKGFKVYRTRMQLNLTVKRFKGAMQLRMDTGTDESETGKVLGTFMRQYLGKEQQVSITGIVKGKQLHLKSDSHKLQETTVPWNDKVIGMYRQQRLLQEKQARPGDKINYQIFEPTVNVVLESTLLVKDYEEVRIPGSGAKKRLLRVETQAEKIEKVQLPSLVTWVDEKYQPVLAQIDMPLLGEIKLVRTTEKAALAPTEGGRLTDIGLNTMIPLNKRMPRGNATTSATFRLTFKGDQDLSGLLSEDEYQQVKKLGGRALEVKVRSRRNPQPVEGAKEPGEEFRKSCYFINSDDARVKEHARAAVGSEKDPWKKALRIEKWVHQHMSFQNDEALATADEAARTLKGDCSEFAMLTAAMCRAEGVPSRTAMGLVYADLKKGPFLGTHMWTEVWVRGRWVPIDATLGEGFVGATHLKVTDHSWQDTRTATPLLPLLHVIGKVSVEVVSASGG
jgi:hypothetical protein